MVKSQCIAILNKSGEVGWTWKAAFARYAPELRSDIAATSLFFVNEGSDLLDIQKLAEQAIAADASRWAGVQLPEEE